MNFFGQNFIKCYMHKKKIVAFSILIVVLLIVVPILASFRVKKAAADDSGDMQCITVWQIDGFEGGRGSRSQYLKNAGEQCFKKEKTYLNVVSLSADAARINLENGEMPDIISYAAGFYGIEKIINGKTAFKSWCRGGYCLISLDEGADFSDVTAENTVVNEGKDNLACVAAAMCGLSGCTYKEPTNAYLQLINGKYKYLLGTQRDVFRFKTRNVPFVLQPVTQFNDLYQNVSILTSNAEKYAVCNRYVNFLLSKDDVGSLGLFNGKGEICAEELAPMKETSFEFSLNYPCSKEYLDELVTAAKNGDANKIKTLLK